jgi:hypothetical protein
VPDVRSIVSGRTVIPVARAKIARDEKEARLFD